MHDYSRYRERDESLKSIGFESYEDYLKSPLWRSVRRKVIDRAKGRCCGCGDTANQVHHRFYTREVLLGIRTEEKFMVAICGSCHKFIEIGDDGKKLPIHKANERLLKLQKKKKEFGRLCIDCLKNRIPQGSRRCKPCRRRFRAAKRKHDTMSRLEATDR